MRLIDGLKEVATLYSDATGTPVKTVSSRIFDDGKKLDAILADEADITTARLEHALQWFSDNWPAGTKWPRAVARPSRSTAEAAQ